ncbi:MAG: hypothetical protein AAFO04_03105 [Cyanobacteria bacterium J06592_8]
MMIQNSPENVLPIPSPHLQKVMQQYWKLANLRTLSDRQQEKLAQILELATESEILAFWIAEIDHIIGHKRGVLETEDRVSYNNQQALLREYLMLNSQPEPENLPNSEDLSCSEEKSTQFSCLSRRNSGR